MARSDDLERVAALLAQLRRGRVVSLRRVRSVAGMLDRLRDSTTPRAEMAGLLAVLGSELLLVVRWFEGRLLDRVQAVCRERPGAGIAEAARIVAGDREGSRNNNSSGKPPPLAVRLEKARAVP